MWHIKNRNKFGLKSELQLFKKMINDQVLEFSSIQCVYYIIGQTIPKLNHIGKERVFINFQSCVDKFVPNIFCTLTDWNLCVLYVFKPINQIKKHLQACQISSCCKRQIQIKCAKCHKSNKSILALPPLTLCFKRCLAD